MKETRAQKRRNQYRELVITNIVAAAERVFAQEGYNAASMNAIAAEVELTAGALYRYFKSKQELFTHIFELKSKAILEQSQNLLKSSLAFSPLIRKVLEQSAELFEKDKNFFRMLLNEQHFPTSTPNTTALLIKDMLIEQHTNMVRFMQRGLQEGVLFRYEAEDLATLLESLIRGFAFQCLLEPKRPTMGESVELLFEMFMNCACERIE